ncbi:MAG: sulfatase-like hydrolase/transferase, partial [Dysosmobacter sp.]|nr:sulfatase-like hydrolase/transferase [Dysosmobacter sp.]
PQLGTLGFTRALENEGKCDAVWAFRHAEAGPYGRFLHSRGLMEEYCEDHLRRAQNPLDFQAAAIPAEAYADNWVTENALAELRSLAEGGRPWFLMVNFSGPHDPWDVTQDMRRRWERTEFPIPGDYTGPAGALMGVRQNYAAMLENIDSCVGAVLEELERLGQGRETVVIYSADHGEMLGDRNRFFKSLPYQPSVHIPLLISGPGILQNHICASLVQLHDLAATIAALAGSAMPPGTDAKSLLPLAAGKDAPPVRNYQYTALYPRLRAPGGAIAGYEEYGDFRKRQAEPGRGSPPGWRCLITERFKYVEYLEGGRPELYDLLLDADEAHNIAEEAPALLRKFQTLLAGHFPANSSMEERKR